MTKNRRRFPVVLAAATTALAAVLALTAGCATRPTRAIENQERKLEPSAPLAEVTIDEKTVVIDARPAFEYALSHVPRAVPLAWTDFTQSGDGARGVLQADKFALARRLARIGVGPDSKVVVVGRGTAGEGEEGRIAWTLRYLGVKNAAPIPLAYFKGPLTSQAGPPPPLVPIWKPDVEEGLLATREELLAVITKGGAHQPIRVAPRDDRLRRYKIIDVRSPREYLGKEGIGLKAQIPNMDAINIGWKEFFDADGRPNHAMRDQLKQLGFEAHHRIIVISERGLRSAAVTVALKDMGFPDVANYAGGLLDLIAGDRAKSRRAK